MAFATRAHFEWKLRTRVVALGERTRLMAIINLTPDSFSGDGLAEEGGEAAVRAGCAAVDGGADIVDLGGESTRPDAAPVTSDDEQARLLPVLEALVRERPKAVISVDTYHAATARAAAARGAEIVNDVSGLQWDGDMAAAVAETGCGLVLTHTRGRPGEWRDQVRLPREAMLADVLNGLAQGRSLADNAGIGSERIVLDPGFGFGKRGRENFALLAALPRLQRLGHGILIGLSRKGFLGEAVEAVQSRCDPPLSPAAARRDATLAANVAAILGGAHILRVHDLQAAREAAVIADAVLLSVEDEVS